MIPKLNSVLRTVYYNLWLDVPIRIVKKTINNNLNSEQEEFKSCLVFFKPNNSFAKNGVVLVTEVRNHEYIIKLAAIAKLLAEKHNYIIKGYDVYINKIDTSWLRSKDIFIKKIVNFFNKDAVRKLYAVFTEKQIYSNSSSFKDAYLVQLKKRELINSININDLDSINALKIDNIVVGDLIYDTYLRTYHQPTIITINKDIEDIIECAINIYYGFITLINDSNIKCFVTTYTAYLHFGIATRICLQKNIPVYTIGANSYRVQQLSLDFPYHLINHCSFEVEKAVQKESLEKAKKILESRFSGKIDGATSYMRQSAYNDIPLSNEIKQLFKLSPRNLVIYVHDFYDSPHMNRKLAFPDLYQYLKQTLTAIQDIANTTVFIKTHPNGIEGCKEQTIELVNSFNNPLFIVLDESVSNLNIVDLKPDLIATARGTICIEMAYFGIPTVALYDNSFANFPFTHTCHTVDEYFAILKGTQAPIINFDKEKIYSFYYQAYLEKLSSDPYELFSYFKSSGVDTFTDDYITHIMKKKDDIFSDKLLEEYRPYI